MYHSFSLYCFGLIAGLYWCNQLTAWYDQTNGTDDGFSTPGYLFPIYGWLTSHLIRQILGFAVSVLLVYDYSLTFGYEIERFWEKRLYHRPSWSSFLFFANRYLALLGYIPIALELSGQIHIGPMVSLVISLLFRVQCTFWRVELF
jgi:hypothetical protein